MRNRLAEDPDHLEEFAMRGRLCPRCGQDGFRPSPYHERNNMYVCRRGHQWRP